MLARYLCLRHLALLTTIELILITSAFAVIDCNVWSENPTEVVRHTSGSHSTPVPTRLTALLFGKLVTVDGCLRVNASFGDVSYLLAWPPDFEISVKEDTIHIVKEDGQEVVVRIGEMVQLSGGEVYAIEALSEPVRQRLPANCPGPYWVVGIEVSPLNAPDKTE